MANNRWSRLSTIQKILFAPFLILSPILWEATFSDLDKIREADEKRKQDKLNKARELVRNYIIEFRHKSSFWSSGTYRELTLRNKPLCDAELDDIMKTVNPNEILKTEIY